MSDSRRLPSDDLLTLAAIKRDGSFDALKVQMLAVLKQDPDLLAVAEAAILHCDAFKEAAADGISDADLQRELRKDPDLEDQLLKEVVRKLWCHATGTDSELCKNIDRTIKQKLCSVHEQLAEDARHRQNGKGKNDGQRLRSQDT